MCAVHRSYRCAATHDILFGLNCQQAPAQGDRAY